MLWWGDEHSEERERYECVLAGAVVVDELRDRDLPRDTLDRRRATFASFIGEQRDHRSAPLAPSPFVRPFNVALLFKRFLTNVMLSARLNVVRRQHTMQTLKSRNLSGRHPVD